MQFPKSSSRHLWNIRNVTMIFQYYVDRISEITWCNHHHSGNNPQSVPTIKMNSVINISTFSVWVVGSIETSERGRRKPFRRTSTGNFASGDVPKYNLELKITKNFHQFRHVYLGNWAWRWKKSVFYSFNPDNLLLLSSVL